MIGLGAMGFSWLCSWLPASMGTEPSPSASPAWFPFSHFSHVNAKSNSQALGELNFIFRGMNLGGIFRSTGYWANLAATKDRDSPVVDVRGD